jgi:hypothetical protein
MRGVRNRGPECLSEVKRRRTRFLWGHAMFGSEFVTRPKIFSTLRYPICGDVGKVEREDDERSPGSRCVLMRCVVSVSRGFSIDLTDQGLTQPRIRCIHCDYIVPA